MIVKTSLKVRCELYWLPQTSGMMAMAATQARAAARVMAVLGAGRDWAGGRGRGLYSGAQDTARHRHGAAYCGP